MSARQRLRRAIKYVAAGWNGLCVFVDNPKVPIDNNRTQRGVRGPTLGCSNFYGSHAERGTKVAPIRFSLVESSKIAVDSKGHLKPALAASLEKQRTPLPNELR